MSRFVRDRAVDVEGALDGVKKMGLQSAGFGTQQVSSMYLPGWRPASFNCWGQVFRA